MTLFYRHAEARPPAASPKRTAAQHQTAPVPACLDGAMTLLYRHGEARPPAASPKRTAAQHQTAPVPAAWTEP